MPTYAVVDGENPGPMQHPAITLVGPDGEPWDASENIPTGTYAKPATSGTLSARPAATVVGQRYLATDTGGGTLYESINGTTWMQVAAGISEVSALAALTPTLEELATGSLIIAGTMSSTQSFPFFVAPFGLSVVQASLTNWESAIATSNTDYYTIALRRTRANVSAVIATKTTQVTGGEAIPQRGEWNFDAVAFDPANKVFLKGDIINLAFTVTGAPTALNKVAVSVRFIPT